MVFPADVSERRAARAAGFTLFEMLVALAVLGVATGAIAALFGASMTIAANNRDVRIATSVADECLHALIGHPERYRWTPDAQHLFDLFPVVPGSLTEGNADVTPPSAMPVEPAAAERTQNEYKRFRWEAYGRLPAENAGYYEVTVVVRWTNGGRSKLVALTSTVARSRVEKAG